MQVTSIAYEQLWLAVGSAGSMQIGKFIARMVLPYFVAPQWGCRQASHPL